MVELLYFANYLIFAMFLSLFAIEVGIALMSLIDYKEYKRKLRSYLMPMWEINGTFAVFYLVNLEATYPTLLPVVGTAFIVPALIAILLVVGRNVFLVASEFEEKLTNEVTYSRIYAITTIIATYLLVSILASSLTGVGLNVATSSLNLQQSLLDPFALLLFASIALFSILAVGTIFNLRSRTLTIASLFATLPVAITAFTFYDWYEVQATLSQPYMLGLFILLGAITLALNFTQRRALRYLMIPTAIIAVLVFGILQYPWMAGGTVSMPLYYTSSALAPFVAYGTMAGCVLLSIVFIAILRMMEREKV